MVAPGADIGRVIQGVIDISGLSSDTPRSSHPVTDRPDRSDQDEKRSLAAVSDERTVGSEQQRPGTPKQRIRAQAAEEEVARIRCRPGAGGMGTDVHMRRAIGGTAGISWTAG
jgi:hypothetical protein